MISAAATVVATMRALDAALFLPFAELSADCEQPAKKTHTHRAVIRVHNIRCFKKQKPPFEKKEVDAPR